METASTSMIVSTSSISVVQSSLLNCIYLCLDRLFFHIKSLNLLSDTIFLEIVGIFLSIMDILSIKFPWPSWKEMTCIHGKYITYKFVLILCNIKFYPGVFTHNYTLTLFRPSYLIRVAMRYYL